LGRADEGRKESRTVRTSTRPICDVVHHTRSWRPAFDVPPESFVSMNNQRWAFTCRYFPSFKIWDVGRLFEKFGNVRSCSDTLLTITGERRKNQYRKKKIKECEQAGIAEPSGRRNEAQRTRLTGRK